MISNNYEKPNIYPPEEEGGDPSAFINCVMILTCSGNNRPDAPFSKTSPADRDL